MTTGHVVKNRRLCMPYGTTFSGSRRSVSHLDSKGYSDFCKNGKIRSEFSAERTPTGNKRLSRCSGTVRMCPHQRPSQLRKTSMESWHSRDNESIVETNHSRL